MCYHGRCLSYFMKEIKAIRYYQAFYFYGTHMSCLW
uniref:Uncharacterized protein n=1 Tax=Setaria italica TaxID=4555 RepID=K3Z162_SETIT